MSKIDYDVMGYPRHCSKFTRLTENARAWNCLRPKSVPKNNHVTRVTKDYEFHFKSLNKHFINISFTCQLFLSQVEYILCL